MISSETYLIPFLCVLANAVTVPLLRASCPSRTGRRTRLASCMHTAANLTSIVLPSTEKRSNGVTKTPSVLAITALVIASATLPPAFCVIRTHMLTVVGRHAVTSSPSSSPELNGAPSARISATMHHVTAGHAPSDVSCTSALSRTDVAALVRSERRRLRLERKNMVEHPSLPTVSSGRSGPPVSPSQGAMCAAATATAMPIGKLFFEQNSRTADLAGTG
mmetsp:Transcript_12926/g.32777  ORF Transcript_12926/g.32777 Transcript_12926/m.32777 type:complete len:220 (+) Transcript_12926:777-1436(+)